MTQHGCNRQLLKILLKSDWKQDPDVLEFAGKPIEAGSWLSRFTLLCEWSRSTSKANSFYCCWKALCVLEVKNKPQKCSSPLFLNSSLTGIKERDGIRTTVFLIGEFVFIFQWRVLGLALHRGIQGCLLFLFYLFQYHHIPVVPTTFVGLCEIMTCHFCLWNGGYFYSFIKHSCMQDNSRGVKQDGLLRKKTQ